MKTFFAIVLLAAAVTAAGEQNNFFQRRGRQKNAIQEFTVADASIAQAKAEAFANAFFPCLDGKSYDAFQALIGKSAGEKFSQENYQKYCRDLQTSFGTFADCKLLCELNNTYVYDFIWKVRFSGKIKTREVLFRVRAGKRNGVVELAGFHFLP